MSNQYPNGNRPDWNDESGYIPPSQQPRNPQTPKKKKKGALTLVIAIVALLLVAVSLTAVLVLRTLNELEDYRESRYEEREDEDKEEADDRKDRPAADAPAVEAPAEEAPVADAPAAEAPASDERFVIAFVPKVVGQAWWDYIGEGVKDWAIAHPEVDVIYKGPAVVDAAAQVQIMTDLINQGVDALLFSPNDPNACEEVCKQAKDAGIVVISTEAASMNNIYYNVEAFDDQILGEFLMKELAAQMNYEGEYITMVGSMRMQSHNNWADAAVAYQKANYPNMTLVADARVSSESDTQVACNKVKELKQKYPNLKGILGTSSFDAPGAAWAIEEMGLTGQMFAVSVALPSEVRGFLKAGVLQSVTLWDPALVAQAMLNLAVDMLRGAEITNGCDLGIPGYESVSIYNKLVIGEAVIAITADNVDKFTF